MDICVYRVFFVCLSVIFDKHRLYLKVCLVRLIMNLEELKNRQLWNIDINYFTDEYNYYCNYLNHITPKIYNNEMKI